jgi:lysophospholipase L1-like esterase
MATTPRSAATTGSVKAKRHLGQRSNPRQLEFDAVADFARAVADPANPEQLNPAYNSGDFLHPNDAGYRAIAASIKPNEL